MAKDKTAKARVLVDSIYGKCDEVVTLDAAAIAEGVKAGALDDNAQAVAYAESIKGK
jgi:hypothetical protein